MTERTRLIYIATNQVNLKSYVGQTLGKFDTRKRRHLYKADGGNDSHFHRALRKYGVDAFNWRVLEEGIVETRLDGREDLWIDFYDSLNNGYNMKRAGSRGSHTTESRQKLSAAQLKLVEQGTHPFLGSSNPVYQRIADGTHHWQQDAHRERLRKNNPMQNPEIAAKTSATLKAKAARGELAQQHSEFAKRISTTLKEKGKRGELPQQNESAEKKAVRALKVSTTKRRKNAEKRRIVQRKAGQQFLFEADDDDG